MATVNLIKAASRSLAGKGTARAERRAGRVPGIIMATASRRCRFRSTTTS